MARDNTWGLTWSRRWHRIDPNGASSVLISTSPIDESGQALCGSSIYLQDQIRAARGLGHLKEILADDTKAAGECQRCAKKVEKLLAAHSNDYAQRCGCGFDYDHRDRHAHLAEVLAGKIIVGSNGGAL